MTVEAPDRFGDLENRRQVGALVKDFYRQVSRDDLLGPIFNQVAEVDWYAHLELLTNYWCRVLLGENKYHGAILQAHNRIHALQALTEDDFTRWYQLWCATIDTRHQGDTAERAKTHAAKIARMLSRMVTQADWSPTLEGRASIQ